MGEVIPLRQLRQPIPEKVPVGVWTCGCESQLWFLLMDGRCVCAQCYCETAVLRIVEIETE